MKVGNSERERERELGRKSNSETRSLGNVVVVRRSSFVVVGSLDFGLWTVDPKVTEERTNERTIERSIESELQHYQHSNTTQQRLLDIHGLDSMPDINVTLR